MNQEDKIQTQSTQVHPLHTAYPLHKHLGEGQSSNIYLNPNLKLQVYDLENKFPISYPLQPTSHTPKKSEKQRIMNFV